MLYQNDPGLSPGITPAAGSITPFIQAQPQQSAQQQGASTQAIAQFADRMRPRRRPTGVMTRAEFDNYVQTYYGVTNVHTGTRSEQETRITRHNVPPPSIPTWNRWDPGTASEDYSSIINGVEEMIDALGAIPQINNIIFFEKNYEPNPATGVGVPDNDTGASFGAGELVIYQAFNGSTSPATGINTGGSTPVRPSSRRGNISYVITHELGHGVAEAGSNRGPEMFRQYNLAVGWVNGTLYDIGQPTVRAAIAANTTPPSQHIITPLRWTDATVMEQPMSQYAVRGGPGEDFAESVAAYVTNPETLRVRSPARYNFLQSHMAEWSTRMRMMMPGTLPPPMGDYPERTLPEGSAYA